MKKRKKISVQSPTAAQHAPVSAGAVYSALSGASTRLSEPLGGSLVTALEETVDESGPVEREEWMTQIGENKALTSAFGAPRKFNTGKQAKKAAEYYIAAKNQQAAARNSVGGEGQSAESLRGPSLMDLHLQQRQASALVEKADNDKGSGHRRPFDREMVSIFQSAAHGRMRRSCVRFGYGARERTPIMAIKMRIVASMQHCFLRADA
ncbi:unnamed protein product [Sphagnum compactum]